MFPAREDAYFLHNETLKDYGTELNITFLWEVKIISFYGNNRKLTSYLCGILST